MHMAQVLDAVLDALEGNTRVEALYIQNFEQVGAQCDWPAAVPGVGQWQQQ